MLAEAPASRRPAPAATTTNVRRAAAAIVAVQVGIWALLAAGGFFRVDDYLYFSTANRVGRWSSTWLTSIQFQHLSPLHRAAWSTLGHATPAAWAAVLVFELALLGAGTWGFYRALELLFGPSPWLLVPVALVGLTLQLSIALSWPSEGLFALPEFAAGTLGLWFYLRYLHLRRRRWLALSVAVLIVGLLFYERTLLAIAAIPLVSILFLEPRLTPAAVGRSLWRARGAYLAYAIPSAACIGYYIHRGAFGQGRSFSLSAFEQYVRILWLRNIPPRTLGVIVNQAGPTTFQRSIEVVAQIAVAAAVVYTLWRKRSAWRAWLFCLLMLAVTAAMTALGRLGELGPVIGYDLRFTSHLPWLLSLGVVYAFHPRRALVVGGAWPAGRRRPALAVLVGAAAVAAVVGGVIQSSRVIRSWHGAAARTYVDRMRSTSARLRTAVIAEGPADKVVAGGYPLARSDIVRATGVRVAVSSVAVPNAVLGPDGRVSPARLVVTRRFALADARVRRALAPTWTQRGQAWCVSGALTSRFASPVTGGEALIVATLAAPLPRTALPVALDPNGAGLVAGARTLPAARGAVGVATGVAALHAFQIQVPAPSRLCLTRLVVGVLEPG